MSDSALAIWISAGSLLLSAGSLVISAAAHRRSTLRRPDRPSQFGTVIAHLRLRLDQLERTVPEAVQSRARVSAPAGRGPGVSADPAAVREPRGRPDKAASKVERLDYLGVETSKSATAHQAGNRLEQLVQFMRDRAQGPK